VGRGKHLFSVAFIIPVRSLLGTCFTFGTQVFFVSALFVKLADTLPPSAYGTLLLHTAFSLLFALTKYVLTTDYRKALLYISARL
jgi:hypothetical protein